MVLLNGPRKKLITNPYISEFFEFIIRDNI